MFMTEMSTSAPPQRFKVDRVWLAVALIPVLIALFDPQQALDTIRFALAAMGHTGIFITFAVLAVGYLKATGSEAVLARAFDGQETRMIFMAAMLGGSLRSVLVK